MPILNWFESYVVTPFQSTVFKINLEYFNISSSKRILFLLYKLNEIAKNHDFIDPLPDDKVINILSWFSNDYYMIMKRKDGLLQLNDLRYGTFSGDGTGEDDYIFSFIIDKKGDYYNLLEERAGPPDGNQQERFSELLDRIKGI